VIEADHDTRIVEVLGDDEDLGSTFKTYDVAREAAIEYLDEHTSLCRETRDRPRNAMTYEEYASDW
jgi:hypothetical protein